MGVTAAFMSQNVLKLLLEFGELAYCLSYNAKVDFFQNYLIKPNPECKLSICCDKQIENKENLFLNKRETIKMKKKAEDKIVKHDENEWGIEIVVENKKEEEIEAKNVSEEEKNKSLENLMDQLKKL